MSSLKLTLWHSDCCAHQAFATAQSAACTAGGFATAEQSTLSEALVQAYAVALADALSLVSNGEKAIAITNNYHSTIITFLQSLLSFSVKKQKFEKGII